MKERNVKQKKTGTRASALTDQKPVKRTRRKSHAPSSRARAGARYGSSAARYLPFILLFFGVVAIGSLLFVGYRTATAAAVFQVRQIDVSGTARVSPDDVRNIVRRSLEDRNVWRADLDLISARLSELTWVRSAVVTRVLPDGLRVRIIERTPYAVVQTKTGRFVWVDDQGVRLIERKPADNEPPLIVMGWNESGANESSAENQKRLQTYARLVEGFTRAGIIDRVSDADLSNVNEVSVNLAGKHAGIFVWLGADNWDVRLSRALTTLDKQQTLPANGRIAYLDARQPNVLVGYDKDVPMVSETSAPEATLAADRRPRIIPKPQSKAVAANPARVAPAAKAGVKTPPPITTAKIKSNAKTKTVAVERASHTSAPPKKNAVKKRVAKKP